MWLKWGEWWCIMIFFGILSFLSFLCLKVLGLILLGLVVWYFRFIMVEVMYLVVLKFLLKVEVFLIFLISFVGIGLFVLWWIR